MNTEKGFTKAGGSKKLIKVLVALIVVAALVLTVMIILSGRRNETPDPQETTASTQAPTEGATSGLPTEPSIPVETQPGETEPGATQPQTTQPGATQPQATQPADTKPGAETTDPVIYAESVTVDKGADTVTVNICVRNNPGIMGAVLKISVDDKVFAFAQSKNTQYPGLTLTASGSGTPASPYPGVLDALALSDADKQDGTLFTVTFKVKDTAAAGQFDVKLSYDKGAIFDEDYNDPKVVLENGTITIK